MWASSPTTAVTRRPSTICSLTRARHGLQSRAAEGRRPVRVRAGRRGSAGLAGGRHRLSRSSPASARPSPPPPSAGVPVTHRGLATAFTVVAGHSRSVEPGARRGGHQLGGAGRRRGHDRGPDGGRHRRRIAERLMAGGMSPAHAGDGRAVGTRSRSRASVRTTLAGLVSSPWPPADHCHRRSGRPGPAVARCPAPSGQDGRRDQSGAPGLPRWLRGSASSAPGPWRHPRSPSLRPPTAVGPWWRAGRLAPGCLRVGCVQFGQRRRALLRARAGHPSAGDDQGGRRRPGYGRPCGLPRGSRPRPRRLPGAGPGGRVPVAAASSRRQAVLLPGGRRPSRAESRAGPARLGCRCRRGLPHGRPKSRARLAGRRQAADAICFASSSAVNSYLDQAGTAPLPSRGGMYRARHGGDRPCPGP